MEHLFTSEALISFLILVVLEVVLGIDNVIFVSIIMGRMKDQTQVKKVRRIWMVMGILNRSLLLLALGWLLQQKGKTILTVYSKEFDLASLVMLLGGLFLIYKSVKEIHAKLEGEDPANISKKGNGLTFGKAIVEIMVIDAVFSFDSILTAGGTAKHVEIMIAAVVIAMIVMFSFSAKISGFIQKHPTLKMLAMSFLVMIGLSLIMEGWNAEAAHEMKLKNYIYFGMAFSFLVEMLNMVMKRRNENKRVVELNAPKMPENISKPHSGDYSDMAH